MLSGKSQSQKVTFYMIPLIQHSLNDNIREIKNELVVAKGWGLGGREVAVAVAIKQ